MKPRTYILLLGSLVFANATFAQAVPAPEENIPFLVTFGGQSDKMWGDDDFCQIFFFSIPEGRNTPVYLRVFDPETGGQHDELKGPASTKVKYSIYGGKGAHSDTDKENKDPVKGFRNGTLLAERTFGTSDQYDGEWYVFGPFNPKEGELKPGLGGYLFKVIAQGIQGDDGNLYRYFMSTSKTSNDPIEGGNAFTYEYAFRLHNRVNSVSHVYPYIDNTTTAVRQHNYDLDGTCQMRIVSKTKKGLPVKQSTNGNWEQSQHETEVAEQGSSMDMQFVNTRTGKNNNVVFYITNQRGVFLPFYTTPIGGVPKYVVTINSFRK